MYSHFISTYFIHLQIRMLENFVSFFGDVETRRIVSRISSSHVTWLVTSPTPDPLYSSFNAYGDAYLSTAAAFSRILWSKIYETFFSGRTHTNTIMFFGSRISPSSRVVNTNCRSVIGFFGRVVGSSWLPRRTTYPELRLWQTSGTHPRRILENPRACLLHATYTQAGITDSRCRHDVDLGLGISSYRRSRAVRDSRAYA